MSDGANVEKIDLSKVDWRGSREFFESLGEALNRLDDKDESFDFTWVGKRKAVIEAGAPINKTFRPDVKASKNWDSTGNLFIEGDNLDALKLLQESYLGKVKMIYIDPPYNTGKDFVYHDNFKASVENYDEDTEYKDESGNIQFKKNEKSNGRYHSDWLSMMYPRLKLARNLLSESGVIFISIDDSEQANLKKICDEIFGEDNFIEAFFWENIFRPSNMSQRIRSNGEYVLCYAKRQAEVPELIERMQDPQGEASLTQNNNKTRALVFPLGSVLSGLDDGIYPPGEFGEVTLSSEIIVKDGVIIKDFSIAGKFKWSQEYLNSEIEKGVELRIKTKSFIPYYKKTYQQTALKPAKIIAKDLAGDVLQANAEMAKLFEGKYFDYPKPVSLIRFLLNLLPQSKDALILDFFSGSATTAHAVMQLNAEDGGSRKHIQVQLPELTDEKSEAFKAGYKTIPEISRERIRRAGDKIASENPDAKVDYGFRSVVIADTNYKDVYKSAGEQQQSTLLDSVDNIKEDRSELDLLYGVLTQSALELNRPCESKDLGGRNVFLYDYFAEVSGLVACFSSSVPEETIKEIAKLKPLTAVFKDSSFATSQDKVNLAEHFRIISPDTKVKVI
ncbi:MAG: site-specific DNA-methyltransferase [Patescibacteria group bacterium]